MWAHEEGGQPEHKAIEHGKIRRTLSRAIAPQSEVRLCPHHRITQQIAHAFGIGTCSPSIFRPEPGANGPSWLTLIAHAKDSAWSVDLFRVDSILFPFPQSLGDAGHGRLHSSHHRVSYRPACIDGVSVCRTFNCATAGRPKPKYLSTDHDPLFRFHLGSTTCACWRSRRSRRFRSDLASVRRPADRNDPA
jgi:hypothetical protein